MNAIKIRNTIQTIQWKLWNENLFMIVIAFILHLNHWLPWMIKPCPTPFSRHRRRGWCCRFRHFHRHCWCTIVAATADTSNHKIMSVPIFELRCFQCRLDFTDAIIYHQNKNQSQRHFTMSEMTIYCLVLLCGSFELHWSIISLYKRKNHSIFFSLFRQIV